MDTVTISGVIIAAVAALLVGMFGIIKSLLTTMILWRFDSMEKNVQASISDLRESFKRRHDGHTDEIRIIDEGLSAVRKDISRLKAIHVRELTEMRGVEL